MKSLVINIFLVLCLPIGSKAQDPHFSQYFASPLTLNPAMGGYFQGDYRFSANFRHQWWAAGAPFVTGTASYDTKLIPLKIPANDIFSAGGMALYDQSLAGGFKSVNISANMSYHKALDEAGENNIGVGFQVSYVSRSINYDQLDFATQFNGSGFDNTLPSYETFGSTRRSYADINAGLLYSYKTANTEVYVGASMFHINSPNTSFLIDQAYHLPSRYTVHAGSRFVIGDNSNELFLGGLYMQQAGATEKNVGIAYGFSLNDEATLYAGSWYRFNEAILPYIGLRYTGLQFGFSYDIINTDLKHYGAKKNGSLEFSMNVLVTKPRNVYTNYKGGRIF